MAWPYRGRTSRLAAVSQAATIRADVGRAVRQLREERGISQETLALRAQLGRSYTSAVERGVRNVGIVNVAKIAEVLELPASAIFERAERLGGR
jgi:XRE family transcriptional regulator, regulator of sulfur utilization